MKQDKDWIDAMRSSLHDAELPPPAGGWQRLERELGEVIPHQAPRRILYWPRFVAAAAAVLVCLAVGEFLWHADRELDNDGVVITTAVGGSAADPVADLLDKEEDALAGGAFQEALADAVGMPPKRIFAALPPAPASVAAAAPVGLLTARVSTPVTTTEGALDGNTTSTESTPNSISDSSPASAPVRSKSRAAVASSQRSPDSERFVAYVAPRQKASFGLFAGGTVTGGTTTTGVMTRSLSSLPMSDAGTLLYAQSPNYNDYSYRHHQPLSFGITARKEFAHGLSLESGVNYTYLRSDVRMLSATEDVSQQLHFIGIPLRLNWQFFERRGFSLYVGAGGMVEKCISAKFGSKRVAEHAVQWSASGAVGAQYSLSKLVGLYFEPEASYYFTKTELRTARTESPMTFTLRLGVRFSF